MDMASKITVSVGAVSLKRFPVVDWSTGASFVRAVPNFSSHAAKAGVWVFLPRE